MLNLNNNSTNDRQRLHQAKQIEHKSPDGTRNNHRCVGFVPICNPQPEDAEKQAQEYGIFKTTL